MSAKANTKGGARMGYIRGEGRGQMYLLPDTIDDYIGEENPIRFLDAFVKQLDLEQLGFVRATAAETGRPGYNPGDLLRLYLYGYLNRIRSSRRLEKEAARNLELMWLLGKLRPDFKTIADFRRDNGAAIRQVCRELTLLCKELDLFGGELIAIDGSRFQAVNGQKRSFGEKKLARLIEEIDAKIEAYLKQLDSQDVEEARLRTPTAEQMQQTLEQWQERKQRYQRYQRQLQQSGEKQISLTDPDSRKITRGDSSLVGYNVQVAIDEKHKLIVEHEVTNAVTDQGQLVPMAERAKQTLGVEVLEVVADMGYYDGAEGQKCGAQGLTVYIPKPQTSANTKLGLFGKERFTYNPANDAYVCPAGETLTYRFGTEEKGRKIRYYSTAACRRCTLKAQCTRNKTNRRLTRWEYEDVLERMQQRLENHPEMMRKRKAIVEHPFGTIKRGMEQSYFLMRGKKHVSTEMSLSILAYNITRVLNILGVKAMLEALA
jgi:transposase